MRCMNEPIAVVLDEDVPVAFTWRGRSYVVREVLDHWRERRAWWRTALEAGDLVAEGDQYRKQHPGARHLPPIYPLVIYHGKCPDGFGAALAAWLYFEGQGEYLGVSHGKVTTLVGTGGDQDPGQQPNDDATSAESSDKGGDEAADGGGDACSVLSAEEKAVRAAVRQVCDDAVDPYIAEWYERGELPTARELAREFGKVGLLGMHLEGYGCAGMSAVDYGLACLELEASDSGIRSLVSVQGSLAMFAIRRWGSEEQKTEWLPRMAAGEAIGCFGLTEPDAGSDPGAMRTVARRDGDDWVLDGAKMWITNGSVACLLYTSPSPRD